MTRGYTENPEEILRSALFKEDYRQMVIVKVMKFILYVNTTCSVHRTRPRGLYPERIHHRAE